MQQDPRSRKWGEVASIWTSKRLQIGTNWKHVGERGFQRQSDECRELMVRSWERDVVVEIEPPDKLRAMSIHPYPNNLFWIS